ncbi:dihydrodipicolinate synthase family protein [Woodsholea maritima]|uniref:dihydrodipicolinate synthase family protein n=1 Tax=Woodsholea maritima TaxID=240237 RepID=UPI0003715E02|nr:dihydrodipicolinate synthase family protein [Woodsholea maritima]
MTLGHTHRDARGWHGVFPAVTTQFHEGGALDLDATARVIDGLIRDGVHGLVLLGTVGENNSLTPEEKRAVLGAGVEAAAGRVPTIVGVSEFDGPRAQSFAKDAQKTGVSGLMALPPMVYMPHDEELFSHFEGLSAASDLPIMLYNNPAAYRMNISTDMIARLAQIETIVALKESSEDTRRFTDLYNALGDRLILFAGLDDVALEGLMLGAKGWISGLTNAFPQESVAIYELAKRGDYARALEIYRWFMPLLHLDFRSDLVQCIKLAEHVMGRGSERVRSPRQVLTGAIRAEVIARVEQAAATRPDLDKLLNTKAA